MNKLLILTIFSTLFIASSCGVSKKSDNKVPESTDLTKEKINHPDLSNVDFYGEGEDSLWRLSVKFNEFIVFSDVNNNIQLKTTGADKQVAQGADVVYVYGETKKYSIKINIDIVACNNSGKIVNIVVTDKSSKKSYDFSGCGFYHGSPLLAGVWELQKMNNTKLEVSKFPRELPHIEFNLKEQKITGFAGCNQIFGTIDFAYNTIIFSHVGATRMYCKETMDIEEKILNIISGNPVYKIENDTLVLSTRNGMLTFTRVLEETPQK